jgi:hypothetical protein
MRTSSSSEKSVLESWLLSSAKNKPNNPRCGKLGIRIKYPSKNERKKGQDKRKMSTSGIRRVILRRAIHAIHPLSINAFITVECRTTFCRVFITDKGLRWLVA